MKLTPGMKLENIVYDTPFCKGKNLCEEVAGHKTMLLFLRYYGCTLCQYDLQVLREEYDKIRSVNGQVKVVFQSDPVALGQEIGDPDAYPFELICDPEQTLYQRFEIRPAANMEEFCGDGGVMEKLSKAEAMGVTHGRYEGVEEQLPAAFVIDEAMNVTYAHYAKDGADMPDVAEMAALLK